MNIIQCSAAPNAKQFADLKSRGFEAVELHLMEHDCDAAYDLLLEHELECYSVHAPLGRSTDFINLNELRDPIVFSRLGRACRLAQWIGNHYGHDMYVVLHNRWNMYEYKCAPEVFDTVANGLKQLRCENNRVTFLIENVTPVYRNGALANGCFIDEIAEVIHALYAECYGVVGICLDMCHFYSTAQYYCDMLKSSKCRAYEELRDKAKFDMLSVMHEYGALIRELHISDTEGVGDTRETHAIPLGVQALEDLSDILGIRYDRFKDLPLMTLEIREDDYTQCANAGAMLPIVKVLAEEALL